MEIWNKTKIDTNLDPKLIEEATILDVVQYPDERLRVVSKPVPELNEEVKQLAYNMIKTMYHADGIGLAAVQVGVHLNLMVIDISENGDSPMVLINPEITWTSDEKEPMYEGCCSVLVSKELREEFRKAVENKEAGIMRHLELKVKYFDFNMQEKEIHTSGLLAHCVQHEYDHFKGKIYLDFMKNKEIKEKFLNYFKK